MKGLGIVCCFFLHLRKNALDTGSETFKCNWAYWSTVLSHVEWVMEREEENGDKLPLRSPVVQANIQL